MSGRTLIVRGSDITAAPLEHESELKLQLELFISSIYENAGPAKGVVAIDVEVESCRHKSAPNSTYITKLKLSSATRLLVISLTDIKPFPDPLARFLMMSEISFVGVNMKWCTDALEKEFGVGCRNAVDLGTIAAGVKGDQSLKWCGLVGLADRVCGIVLEPDAHAVVAVLLYRGSCGLISDAVRGHVCYLVGSSLLGAAGAGARALGSVKVAVDELYFDQFVKADGTSCAEA